MMMNKAKVLSEYPEHEKLKARQRDVGLLSEFYDFITMNRGWEFAEWDDKAEQLVSVHKRPDEIIGMFLGVDPKKLEAEKVAMLNEIRRANEQRTGG